MKYANQHGYSDVTPYEVVRKVSEKTLEIRRMKAERDPTWKPEIVPGGFAGHCTNQESQRWIIESDADASITRIRLGKNGQWKSPHGGRFQLSDTPRRFYDYNF